jgi:hypothetical protein
MFKITYRPSLLKRLRNVEHFDLFENIVLHIQEKAEISPLSLLQVCESFYETFSMEKERKEETVKIREAHIITVNSEQ